MPHAANLLVRDKYITFTNATDRDLKCVQLVFS